MALRPLPERDPDWRLGPLAGRRLLFAVTRALAGQPSGAARASGPVPGAPVGARGGVVVARATHGGRCLELVCAGDAAPDVVALVAPAVGRFGAELVVQSIADTNDPAINAALRRGGVVVWGSLDPAPRPGLAQAPA